MHHHTIIMLFILLEDDYHYIFLHKSSPHEFNRIIILHLYFDPPTYNRNCPYFLIIIIIS